MSSAEAELHALQTACSEAVFINNVAEFLPKKEVKVRAYTDSEAARLHVKRPGVGKIRHLDVR
eukprot:7022381-Alexandrium_andersonii.AAC.1